MVSSSTYNVVEYKHLSFWETNPFCKQIYTDALRALEIYVQSRLSLELLNHWDNIPSNGFLQTLSEFDLETEKRVTIAVYVRSHI